MTELTIEADDAGRYWLDIEIATVPVKAYIDTGLIGSSAPRVMLTKDAWAKVESKVHSAREFKGVDGQGNPWLIKHASTKVRVPSLGVEFDETIGAPSHVNVIGSLFFDNLKSYEIVINCERRLMTIRKVSR
jgi:hypothetical protein